MYTHVIVRVHAAEVDTHQAGVQPVSEAVTDMTHTGLGLCGGGIREEKGGERRRKVKGWGKGRREGGEGKVEGEEEKEVKDKGVWQSTCLCICGHGWVDNELHRKTTHRYMT